MADDPLVLLRKIGVGFFHLVTMIVANSTTGIIGMNQYYK